MKIGIVADTHDHMEHIEECVALLKEKNVDLVIHLGDFVAPFALIPFKGLKMVGVLGNNDGEVYGLTKKFEELGMDLHGHFWETEIDGLKIAAYHGTVIELRNSLIDCGKYDVVLYGHTHQLDIRTQENTLVINPGTVHGVLAEKATFAILDTETKKVEVVEL